MAIEVIRCPNCNDEVRVPETLFGTSVRCPRCRAYFKAPVRNSDGALVGVELLPDPVEPAQPLAPAQKPLLLPGVLLLLIGLMGALADGFVVYGLSNNIDEIVAQTRAMLTDPNHPLGKAAAGRIKPEDVTPEQVRMTRTVHAGSIGVSVLIMLGAVAMLGQRFWRFCIATCVLAMVNLGACCLVLGVPIGLWALIRLLDPSVKAQFR